MEASAAIAKHRQPVGEPGQVLGVVPDDQRVLRFQRLCRLIPGADHPVQLQRNRQRLHRLVGIVDPGQWDKDDRPAEARRQVTCRAHRQPALPRAPLAGQGDQPALDHQRLQLGELAFPPKEARRLAGEGDDACLDRPWRWEFGRQAIGDELVQTFGSGVEILQPVLAERTNRRSRSARRQKRRGLRHEHLAAVRGSAHARRPVHLHTHVAGADHIGDTGVQAHSHPDCAELRPWLAREPALGLCRGGGSVRHAREGDEEGIACRIDLDSIRKGDAQDLAMPIQKPGEGVRERTCQPGRALDVREQEGHGAGRQLAGLVSALRPARRGPRHEGSLSHVAAPVNDPLPV